VQWFILTVFSCLVSAAVGEDRSPMSDAVEAVKKAEREFREALLRSDIETLGKLLTEDFIRTPPTTPATTKTQWLDLIRTGKQKYLAFDVKEAKYRAYGDTVIVNAVVSLRVRRGNEEATDLNLRLLQVWVKQDGRWLLAAIQGNQTPTQ
jgi:ketosteroid isomerase-like protein